MGIPDATEARETWARRTAPILGAGQFSLWPLRETARLEILYSLQQRDLRRQRIEPFVIRQTILHMPDVRSIALLDDMSFERLILKMTGTNRTSLIREWRHEMRRAFEEFRGIKPTDKLVWDLAAAGIRTKASSTASYRNTGSVDFGVVQVAWLRDVLMDWARSTKPYSYALRRSVRACHVASDVLAARPNGGTDVSQLRFSDMTAIANAFRELKKEDGAPFTSHTQRSWLRHFLDIIDHGRANDLLDDLPGSFSYHKTHAIKDEEANEEEIGKAIPEFVISQLDAHSELLGRGIPYGQLGTDAIRAMAKTVYILLRDTGRRPQEVAKLALNCLESNSDGYYLLWDNFKGRRKRRRLPLTRETAEAIKSWQRLRATLPTPSKSAEFLFPAKGPTGVNKSMNANDLSVIVRRFADSIPELYSEEVGLDGLPVPFDRSLIFPYAFRFSFAQRHADAGTPVDVLKELMDHKTVNVTMGYYNVSLKRKREAVKTLRSHVIDRSGKSSPMASNTAYELSSVAVPFGNCIEPSNVKAGGQACPIRFQCSGCSHYRPDPSHLPAIEEQVRSLMAKLEIAKAMEVADWTIKGMEAELAAYEAVVGAIREKMADMDDEERRELEEASKVMRRLKAGGLRGGPVDLPMPAVPARIAKAV
ncbi:tyrosine-type recombinase/integrase [Kitasatospora sp. LaBMicrA B282]|uniref:tyrosine-type recombinase/integrase n=1 Tax=Kitasatospora sp. LaBMicrA B282 TaxID=3420949 RepID=UPI003D0F4497